MYSLPSFPSTQQSLRARVGRCRDQGHIARLQVTFAAFGRGEQCCPVLAVIAGVGERAGAVRVGNCIGAFAGDGGRDAVGDGRERRRGCFAGEVSGARCSAPWLVASQYKPYAPDWGVRPPSRVLCFSAILLFTPTLSEHARSRGARQLALRAGVDGEEPWLEATGGKVETGSRKAYQSVCGPASGSWRISVAALPATTAANPVSEGDDRRDAPSLSPSATRSNLGALFPSRVSQDAVFQTR